MSEFTITLKIDTDEIGRLLGLLTTRLEALEYDEAEPEDKNELAELEALEAKIRATRFD